jgi:dihydrofolate synthase / folylpolyglutamate synthase
LLGPMGQESAKEILEAAKSVSSGEMHVFGRDFRVNCRAPSGELYSLIYSDGSVDYWPGLKGAHQADNIGLAIRCCKLLGVSDSACQRGAENVFWPARLEEISYGGRTWLLDCAHNMAGVRSLTRYLEETRAKNLSLAFGVLRDKHWEEIVTKLKPYVANWNLLKPRSSRALDPGELQAHLSGNGINARVFGDDYEALVSEVSNKKDSQTVLVAGSMYMVGGIRELLTKEDKPIWTRAVS